MLEQNKFHFLKLSPVSACLEDRTVQEVFCTLYSVKLLLDFKWPNSLQMQNIIQLPMTFFFPEGRPRSEFWVSQDLFFFCSA